MTVDVRAKVFCNLGTVIQASLADEALSSRQGLIRCRGQVVLQGLSTPQVGSFAYFGWERDGTIARIPRTLRVLSSFADPFRNTTTVQLGDKLVYLANLRGKKADPTEQEPKPETPNKPPVPDPQPGPEPEDYPGSEYTYDEDNSCYLPKPGEEPHLFGSKDAAEVIQALEPYLMAPASIKNRAPLTIRASSVLGKCLAALGIARTGASLIAQFTQDSFDLSSGYVTVIDQLLANESLYGYLNEDEVLVINQLTGTPANGPLITSDTLIDLSGINEGILPGQQVTVAFESLDLKPEPPPEPDAPPEPDEEPPPPEAEPGPNDGWDEDAQPPEGGTSSDLQKQRDWEYETSFSYGAEARFYLEDGYEVAFPYNPRTDVYTYYDEHDYVIKRITKTYTIVAAEAASLIQAQLQAAYDANNLSFFNVPQGLQAFATREIRSGSREEFTYKIVEQEDAALPLEELCPGDEPRVIDEQEAERVEKVPLTQTTYSYQSSLVMLGQMNISGVDWGEYPLNSLPNYDILTNKVVITYDQNQPSGQTKTRTERFVIHGNTQQGQQDTAEKGKVTTDSNGINQLLDIASDLRYEETSISIQQDRTYGVQKRPSETDRIKEEQKKQPQTGSGKNTTTNTQVLLINQQSYTTESQSDLELDMPYGSDDGFVWTASDGFQFSGGSAATLALRYARSQNAILRGNRAGVSLQLPAYVMPLYPLQWVYLQAANVTGGYRANGMSWAMNSEGVLCSMDALFWGGVSGSGTAWFPVAPGTTSLPSDPTVTTGTGTPANAMSTPSGFDPSAPGGIWSTLPVATAPSYDASITPTALVPVVNESVPVVAGTRTALSVTALDYALTLPTGTAVLVTKAEMTVAAGLVADATTFTATGQDSSLVYVSIITLNAESGSLTLTGQAADLVYTYPVVSQFSDGDYSGSSSSQSITGLGFKPGMVWFRKTSGSSEWVIADMLRPINELARPNAPVNPPDTSTQNVQSFDSDGFTIGNSSFLSGAGTTWKYYAWKEGTTPAANTNGSLAVTESLNAAMGLSYLQYTGTGGSGTIGHSLGVTPDAFIVYRNSLALYLGGPLVGNNKFFTGVSTSAAASSSSLLQSYSSTTISVGDSANTSGVQFTGYAFVAKSGYSAIGSYVGSGTTLKNVNFGFAPRFVIIKALSGSSEPFRGYYTPAPPTAGPRYHTLSTGTTADAYNSAITFTSTGIQFNGTTISNSSGRSYWYLAFA